MNRGPEKIGRFLGAMMVIAFCLLLSSCSTYRLSTLNHDPLYGPHEVALEVPSDVQIDTLSYSQFKRKLRNDFSFRYDFAQYAINQPYSWYMSNYSFNYWRPFTSFDMYWNRHNLWMDWAFNYPFNYGWSNYGWNSYSWGYGWHNRPWWSRPYSPWNSWYNGPFSIPGHNVVWNSGRENVAYMNGPRGSRGNTNSNISNDIIIRNYNGRNKRTIDNSNENSTINTIVSNLRDKFNNVRVYTKPNNVPTNNGRPVIINNNNNSKPIRGSWRPSNNSNNNNSYKPVYNNNNNINSSSRIYTRPTGNSSNSSTGASSNASKNGGSSRGGNSNRGN